MPLFRDSRIFESLILSHHSRFACECNKEDINDDDDVGIAESLQVDIQVDVRLTGKFGPVGWILTIRLSIKNSLSDIQGGRYKPVNFRGEMSLGPPYW